MIVLEGGKKRQFTSVAFSGDASQLAAGGGGEQCVVWDTATGRKLHSIDRAIGHATQSLAFHPSAAWVYVANSYGLTAFNTTTGITQELWGKEEFARNIAVDPTGRWLIGSRHKLWTNQSDLRWLACLKVDAADKPVKAWERPDVDAPNEGWANLLAFFADGEQFVSAEAFDFRMRMLGVVASESPRITIRKTSTGETLHTLKGAGTEAEQLAVAPSGETLVTRVNRRLYVFDLKNNTAAAKEFKNDGRSHFTGIAFHPSGRFLAATSNDKTVKLYDTVTWQVAQTFTWEIGRMRSIAFSPDGTLAAAGSDSGKVVVWDVDV